MIEIGFKIKKLRPKNPLLRIKYRYLEWRWDRILRKSGHRTWYHYFRANDLDYNPYGKTIKEQLHGYPYIFKVDFKKIPMVHNPLFGPIESCEEMLKWCDKNCRKNYRAEWERVIQDHEGQYLPNGIGGSDELFFAFKDERDYLMFVLKWS